MKLLLESVTDGVEDILVEHACALWQDQTGTLRMFCGLAKPEIHEFPAIRAASLSARP